MKNFILFAFILLNSISISAQNLKPYVLAIESNKGISVLKSDVFSALKSEGLEVIGEYMPANDKSRYILVFTSDDLKNAVKSVGGLTGFAGALRVGITVENGKSLVTYTNPKYWGNAYFRDDYPKVEKYYIALSKKLAKALGKVGDFKGGTFGSEEGISAEDLREYHYMMSMPYFDDTEELEDFDSYQEAISKIEGNLKKGVPNVKKVYRLDIPGKNLTLYGFGLSGEDGESKFMPIIDIDKPKHTVFLPYEMLVLDKEVHMLHGRYRIALSFPDLTMGTFTKIMSTPGNIEELLEQLVE